MSDWRNYALSFAGGIVVALGTYWLAFGAEAARVHENQGTRLLSVERAVEQMRADQKSFLESLDERLRWLERGGRRSN